MNLLAYALLADENIHPDVVNWLRDARCDVRTVLDEGLAGHTDSQILARANAAGRVVLTHDSDFGTLAVRRGEPLIGIIYLRPGHRTGLFTIETLRAVQQGPVFADPPFIAVIDRRDTETRVRVRRPLAI